MKQEEKEFCLRSYFEQLRFDENHHLGMGDIRLTIGMQNEICEAAQKRAEELQAEVERMRDNAKSEMEAFDRWKAESGWFYNFQDGKYVKCFDWDKETMTFSDLYELFKQSKQ